MKLRIGSRESKLAVIQTQIVMDAIKEYAPSIDMELVTMKTTGDILQSQRLDKIGGKGLFIKELESALLDGRIDLCVHSFKDMPMDENPDLPIVALSEREEPLDVLILPEGATDIDYGKPIGCSSLRRTYQMRQLEEKATFALIRGNVITRLKKLDSGEYGALILAQAGIKRLGLCNRISKVFDQAEILPATSQGILAVQGRKGCDYGYLEQFHSKRSEVISLAERGFLKTIGGGCSSPNAAFAVIDGNTLSLYGMYVPEGTEEVFKAHKSGSIDDAKHVGISLANEMLKCKG